MKRLFLALILLLACPALAQEDAPIVYSKTTIRIVPKPVIQLQKDTDDEKKKSNDTKKDMLRPDSILPKLPRIAKEFTVEIRPLRFLQQQDYIEHQPFTDKEGMMFIVDPKKKTALTSANVLSQVDVLFVTPDGVISQIAPDLALSTLDEPIESDKPVKALIFLKGGVAKLSDIKPGDRVEHAMFKTHPIILEDSSSPPATPIEPAPAEPTAAEPPK